VFDERPPTFPPDADAAVACASGAAVAVV
jgi:hypothetical protein